jgi:hypothetical protein
LRFGSTKVRAFVALANNEPAFFIDFMQQPNNQPQKKQAGIASCPLSGASLNQLA